MRNDQRVFDAYARYYDLLYRDKDYSAESEYIAGHIRRFAPQASRILELGCGTGAHAEHFARMGFTVHGIDMSDTMLEGAEARKRSLPAAIADRLSFGKGDVTTVRTDQRFDVVISLFHVISYQTTDAALQGEFQTAATHLDRGGLFLFDFWYGPAVLAQQPDVRIRRLEDELIRVTRIAEPVLRASEHIVDVNYTVFIEEKSTRRIEEVRETHHMRYLFPDDLHRFPSAWFEQRVASAWMSSEPMDDRSWAGFQVLQRI